MGAPNRIVQTLRQRARVRSRLRWAKERWRRTFPERMPTWDGPVGGSASNLAQVRDSDRVTITADSVGRLRAHLYGADSSEKARVLEIVVKDWGPPRADWSGRLGPLPGVIHHEIRLPGRERGMARVTVTVARPVPLRWLLAAALPTLLPGQPLPSPVSADVATDGGVLQWLPPGTRATDVVGAVRSNVARYDIHLATSTEPGAVAQTPEVAASPYGVVLDDGVGRVIVDGTTANPRGRQRAGPALPSGRLNVVNATGDAWWHVVRSAGTSIVAAGRVGDPLDERQSATLAQLGCVSGVACDADVPAMATAAAIVQLAMTGVVLHLPDLDPSTAALLADDLVTVTASPLPDPDADPVEWEIRGIVQRRNALRHHATAFAMPVAAATAYPTLARRPAVTAVLVTRRPGNVATVVAELAAQTYPELEIVVGLHGCDLPAQMRDRLADHGRPVQVVAIPGGLTFGEALGEATRIARGSLVTKVDDDDRYGPEHVWDLVLARHYSGATVVGKGAEFVYLEALDQTVRRWMGSELYSDVVAGGTMLLSRGDLESVGGWRPLARSVDRALLDRVLAAGGLVYRTHGFGFVYTRHGSGHTWDPGVDYFLRDPRRRWQGLPPYREFGDLKP